MTEDMEYAAARFKFLFNKATMKQTADFIYRAFGVSVSQKTVSKKLKRCGFTLIDLKVSRSVKTLKEQSRCVRNGSNKSLTKLETVRYRRRSTLMK
jgi:transposase